MTQPETGLQITLDDQLSINDLTGLQAEGFSVLRSAHVGNFRPYNLALADAGIPFIAVDHTITGTDRNYFPEVMAGKQVAPLGVLTCRARLEDGTVLSDAQVAETRRITGNANIVTNTNYLRDNETVAGEIVSSALKLRPDWFTRLALPDGTVADTQRGAAEATRYGIMQLNDDPQAETMAVLIPNQVDIIANFVIEALQSGRDVQYHLSGPDMYKYLDIPELQAAYAQILGGLSFKAALPERLEVRLVPTDGAGFATTVLRRPALDAMLRAVADEPVQADLLKRQRKIAFTDGSLSAEDKALLLKANNTAKDNLRYDVDATLVAVPELWLGKNQPGYVTQYDVAVEGGLYVAPVNRTESMAALSALTKQLGRRARKASP